jgi:hypothetical protein
VFGVLLLLEVVAELVENSRRVLSAWAHFHFLLDCLLYSTHLGSVFSGEAFGKGCCILREQTPSKLSSFQMYYYALLSSLSFIYGPVLALVHKFEHVRLKEHFR